ncbi:FAD-binding oxidoreductase [Parachryseolinea silvisoli]|uniref:FAD-binding oxidoreductase n=1 Tax=Parachryseolinea silvisoli TaxID=2873601 RepID=UPI002265B39E|nr:FAD-binding oxidoreductase [Parachryseolinea silvisoli]MCD9014496.1 FAD-binding oxidoreductase [Parachryseolinea silvisoli]
MSIVRFTMQSSEETLSGWGNIPAAASQVFYPQTARDIRAALDSGKILPRGLGRSYADQATNREHHILKMEKMNHFLAFDAEKGILHCEAGVSLEEIIDHLAPRGWFPLITPGTKFITIGGAIANDVHGKAHHADGSFVNCVYDFTILLANGEIVRASRDENADLFWANFGGLGLLGTILTATIQLRKIETTYFVQKAVAARNLDEMLAAIDVSEQTYSSSVAWIDSMAKGKNLGRGVLTMGNHALLKDLPPKLRTNPLKLGKKAKLAVPFYLPSFTLNTLTVKILNTALYIMQKNGAPIAHYDKFFYPLDMINNWNRGYGKRGFIQYQFVLPMEKGPENIRKILTEITQSNCVPFLNVLKKFGKGQGGLLSFPFEGYTFAIDFPITEQLKPFTQKLDKMVLDMGGRIYLGKDAYLDEPTFKAMYPQHKDWLDIKKKYDPRDVFSSDLSRRIGLA